MISIALGTYNGGKFLQEQLDSIENQTLLPDELVICDDCSGDSTIAILEKFREKVVFPVHIHQNDNNLGSTRNFEKAIGLCSGDIIVLSDQDDVWKPEKLARMSDVFRENPQAGFVFSDADLVDEHLRLLDICLWDSVGFTGEFQKHFLEGDQFRCLMKQPIVTGATMAFRASVGKLAMPFPAEGHFIHDGWIALVSSAAGKLGIAIEDSLIDYRQHSSQLIGAPDPEKKCSLLGMYLELKASQQALFTAWEKDCLQILSVKDILQPLRKNHNSAILEQNCNYLDEFETHYLNRRKILTSKDLGRYGLILQETFSGRYAEFSDSWQSIFRDLFL